MSGAYLLLEDGTRFDGLAAAPRARHRRGRLQHLDDRLPGDGHRSLLRGPDHRLHLPADRQLRRQRRGDGVRSGPRPRRRHARRQEPRGRRQRRGRLARLARRQRRRRGSAASTPAPWSATSATAARCTAASSRRRRRKPRRASGSTPSPRWPAPTSPAPSPRRSRSASTGDGLHVVALDCGAKSNILRHLAEHGVKVTVSSPDTTAEEILATTPTASSSPTAPATPPPSTTPSNTVLGILGQAPDLRHLPRPPAPRPRHRRQDLQAQVRPPRRQPAGQEPRHRPRRNHQPEPRLRRRGPGRRAEIEGDEPVAGDRLRGRELSQLNLYDGTVEGLVRATSPSPPSSTTPRPAPARTTPATCSTASWSWRRDLAAAAGPPVRIDRPAGTARRVP